MEVTRSTQMGYHTQYYIVNKNHSTGSFSKFPVMQYICFCIRHFIFDCLKSQLFAFRITNANTIDEITHFTFYIFLKN